MHISLFDAGNQADEMCVSIRDFWIESRLRNALNRLARHFVREGKIFEGIAHQGLLRLIAALGHFVRLPIREGTILECIAHPKAVEADRCTGPFR